MTQFRRGSAMTPRSRDGDQHLDRRWRLLEDVSRRGAVDGRRVERVQRVLFGAWRCEHVVPDGDGKPLVGAQGPAVRHIVVEGGESSCNERIDRRQAIAHCQVNRARTDGSSPPQRACLPEGSLGTCSAGSRPPANA